MNIAQMKEEGTVSVLRRTGGNINRSWQVVLTSWRLSGMCVCVCVWLINHRALTQLKWGKRLRFSRNTEINGGCVRWLIPHFHRLQKRKREFLIQISDSEFIRQIKKCIYSWWSTHSPLDSVGNVMTSCKYMKKSLPSGFLKMFFSVFGFVFTRR